MNGSKQSAQYKIEDVEGIGPAYCEKLCAAGVINTDRLLAAGKTKKDRAATARKAGISEAQLLKWVNMVDLYRIKGIGSEFSELLEASGVDTAKELKHRIAAKLPTGSRRYVRSGTLLNLAGIPGESDEDGLDELFEFMPSSLSSSLIRFSNLINLFSECFIQAPLSIR